MTTVTTAPEAEYWLQTGRMEEPGAELGIRKPVTVDRKTNLHEHRAYWCVRRAQDIFFSLLALVIKTFATGARSEDLLGSYICAGIGGALMAQIAVNVGMNLRVLPVIGVTLPFYSAGGSSVLMLYICVGLVLSVYMHNTKSLFG